MAHTYIILVCLNMSTKANKACLSALPLPNVLGFPQYVFCLASIKVLNRSVIVKGYIID